MAGKQTKKGEIVRMYCQNHPAMAENTLARMIYAEHGKHWNGTKDEGTKAIRLAVRYYRGKHRGGHTQKCIADPVPTTYVASYVRQDYQAPETLAEPYEDFTIHGAQRILRLSDIHYPFHDPKALEAAVNYGVKMNPTILLLNGDIIDCHDLSDHDRDPSHRYTDAELKMIASELDQFRMAFPSARIIWTEGNHEARLKRYITRKAPELWGLPMLDIPGLVTMASGKKVQEGDAKQGTLRYVYVPNLGAMRGVEWISDKRVVQTGHLANLHGHEFGNGGGGVNPARWLFLRAGENAICGHFHRTSEHSEPSLSRTQRGAWSTGCLCDMRPSYMPHNKWNHGFAFIEVDASGEFAIRNHRVMNGKVY